MAANIHGLSERVTETRDPPPFSHRADDVVQGGHVCPQARRGLGGHLQPPPQYRDGKLWVGSGRQPETEVRVGLCDTEVLDDLFSGQRVAGRETSEARLRVGALEGCPFKTC